MTTPTPVHRRRHGTTLVELLITLVILATTTSMVTLAVRQIDRPHYRDPIDVIADTMPVVLSTGRAASLLFDVDGHLAVATVFPDGTVIADSMLSIDRFTGRHPDAR